MADGTKNKRRRAFPQFAAEFAKAVKQSGLSHTELQKRTKISRTVLHGYEAGRTFPGVGELRVLSEVLGVTPNQFIFGTEQPFKKDLIVERFGLTTDHRMIVGSMVLMSMLTRSERVAIMTVVESLAEARLGAAEVNQAREVIKIMAEEMGDLLTVMEPGIEAMVLGDFANKMKKRLIDAVPPSAPKPPRSKRSSHR